jgi:hypothetical protein
MLGMLVIQSDGPNRMQSNWSIKCLTCYLYKVMDQMICKVTSQSNQMLGTLVVQSDGPNDIQSNSQIT